MKRILLKSLFLLCALVVGGSNGWAVDVEIFNVAGGGDVPTGWTLVGEDKGDYWLLLAGGTDYVQTSSYDVSAYDKVTITAKVATFDSGTNPHAKIEISYNGGTTFTEVTTQGDPTSKSYVDISYELSSTSNSVVIKVSNSISSGKGLRFKNFVLTGTSSKAAAGLSYTTSKYATTFGAAFATPVLTNPNSLAVTYATSDATVADVNTSTGAVTIKSKIGSATITASTEGDATHSAGNASYTIYVFEHDGSAANNAYTFSEAKTFISNEFYDADTYYYVDGIVSGVGAFDNETKGITYYVSEDGSSTGALKVVKGKGLNGADFAAASDMQRYDIVTLHGKFNLNNTTSEIINSEQVFFKRKNESGVAAIADFEMYRDTEMDAEDLFTITSDGVVSYESSDETIAKIEGGKLKALAVGSATITINVAATDDYREGSDEVVVTVKNRPAVIPAGSDAGTGYFKVTDASTLTEGDQFILVGDDAYAMAGQSGSVRTVQSVTVSNGSIASISANVQVVTLEGSTGEWYLKVEDNKYLCATSSDKNYIGTTATKTNEAKATISINASGEATIVFQGSNTKNNLRYNYNSGSPRFTCYNSSSTMVKPVIYRYANVNTFDVTIGATGYKTLISAVSATLPAGLTAYKAVSAGEGKIQLTSVESIKAGSAYVLKGTASTDYTLTVTDTPEEPTDNILEVSTESTSNGVYVLSNGSSGVGFYKWMGGSLGAGRAIVPASAVTGGAHEFLGFDFDGETTAINNLTPSLSQGEGEYYDLQGRKVAQPTKGLYIVNGKKVIVK